MKALFLQNQTRWYNLRCESIVFLIDGFLQLNMDNVIYFVKQKHSIAFLFFLFATLNSNTALSQPLIEELQQMSFGTLAVPSNSSVSRFTVPQTGRNLSIEGQFIFIATASPGRYRFSGFPAVTRLNVSLEITTLTTGASNFPEPLTVDAYDFDNISTDENGDAELSLGARLTTSGNGTPYVDAPYSGTATLRVRYWQPEADAFVFNSKTIDIDVELRSTITLVEEQPLNFGTLFARTSTTEMASLVLSPTGSYTLDEPSGSRLVVLAKPEQAKIRIVGASPFYQLTITPQIADAFLKHTEFPEIAPHFIFNSLVAFTDGPATTDANGELEIEIGGTLQTEVTTSSIIYPSGIYEGTYEFTVAY